MVYMLYVNVMAVVVCTHLAITVNSVYALTHWFTMCDTRLADEWNKLHLVREYVF